jgi:hypothetical protein
MTQATKLLDGIDDKVEKILISKQVNGDLGIEKALDEYMQVIQSAAPAKLQDITDISKPQPQTSPAKQISALEKLLISHRNKLEMIVAKIGKIDMRIRDGEVLLSPEYIRSLSPEELSEFKRLLTPKGLQKNQKKYKDIVGQINLDIPPQKVSCLERFFKQISNIVVPEAEAALAVGCVASCGTLSPACVGCVGGALGTGAYLTVELQNALKKCNKKKWSWQRKLCKSVTILAYVTIIA